ncbi:MAG: aminoacyl-histidine dipeptidase [Moraxella sp.]|nr:aminoacyl-histidine dipeptidase [Moraxella sp.]
MSEISTLTPQKIWQWFDAICSIPHNSYQEQALAEHIVNWAKSKNFETHTDKAGNVFITKPATKGFENHAPIALQAHLDMVCQSNEPYDFSKEPIRPVIAGEWVKATGTTLGADNGMGLASILAVLDSDDLKHPMLEAVLTVSEETGMEGAINLERGRLKSKIMINTDTEEINEIYVGCAGGIDADIRLAVNVEPLSDESVFEFKLFGLKGGHSGIDIHKNHENAIKWLAYALSKTDARLVSLKGGTARNAIPRMATAVVAVSDKAKFINGLTDICNDIKTLIGHFETGVAWEINELNDKPSGAVSTTDTKKIINFINGLPNGVVRNSDKVAGVVETSLSLGKITLNETGLHATSLLRSLNDIGKETAMAKLASVCDLTGASVEFSGSYVGWEPNPTSPITQITKQVYANVIGFEPKLNVIHAGLECGLLCQAYPKMDIVSIGPTIHNAHSPDECVHIDSVNTYWQVLVGVLENAPKAA